MLKGNEGLTMSGKEIVWITGLDLYLKSVVSIFKILPFIFIYSNMHKIEWIQG